MTYFFLIASGLVALKIILLLFRVLRGPTIFDRMLGTGVIGTGVILLLLLLGFVTGREDMYIDMAMAYAALGFIGYLIVAKYFERKGDIDG